MDDLIRRLPVGEAVKHHLLIVYYLVLVLFILMYATTEVQPFVYVRF